MTSCLPSPANGHVTDAGVRACGIDVRNGTVNDCSSDTVYGPRSYAVCPPEHVIEIRTKRRSQPAEKHVRSVDNKSCSHVKYKDCGHYGCMPDGVYVCSGDWCQDQCVIHDNDKETTYSCPKAAGNLVGERCVRVTREVWIDGTRYGTLREYAE